MPISHDEKNSVLIEKRKSGVCVLRLDTPGKHKNSINLASFLEIEKFLNEIEDQMDMVESDDEIQAVIITSDKKDSFINGANTEEFLDFMLADEGRTYSLKTQEIVERIEKSRVPFLAAMHGPCLGAGLEIALACDYRITTDSDISYLGMNQIDLGLIPSSGGMHRLVRLVGIKDTLDLVLSGDSVGAHYALSIGLVDEVVPVELLSAIADKRSLELSTKELKRGGFEIKGIFNKLVSDNPASRKMAIDKARKQIRNNSEHNAGAAAMAIEAIEIGLSNMSRGVNAESVYFGELCVTNYTKELIKSSIILDSLRERNASIQEGTASSGLAIVGCEGAGPQIASLAAENGIRVRLKGEDRKAVGRGLGKCFNLIKERSGESESGEGRAYNTMNFISGTSDYSGFKGAAVILESLGEELESKRRILHETQPLMNNNAIYITNSFVLPVSDVSGDSDRPRNVVGMRVFNSVYENELVEIITTDDTSDSTLEQALAFTRDLGRLPIVVRDGAGSFTARIWLFYLNEALYLLEEGLSLDTIEDAMTEFGFSTGPLAMIDSLGADLVAKSIEILNQHFGERMKPHPFLEHMISNERLGKKSGRGFYKYGKVGAGASAQGKLDGSVYRIFSLKENEAEDLSEEYIQERLILALINEAALCLHEGIVTNVEEADMAVVLALGFPDFRGGPFRYADSIGVGEVLKKLHNLSVRHGLRFSPPVILKNVAVATNKFYETK